MIFNLLTLVEFLCTWRHIFCTSIHNTHVHTNGIQVRIGSFGRVGQGNLLSKCIYKVHLVYAHGLEIGAITDHRYLVLVLIYTLFSAVCDGNSLRIQDENCSSEHPSMQLKVICYKNSQKSNQHKYILPKLTHYHLKLSNKRILCFMI